MDILVILRSRYLIYKNKQTSWYKERIKICSTCNNNSKFNLTKTFKEKVWKLLNLNNDYCGICHCGIKHKTAVPEEECSMVELNEEPKWKSIVNTKYKEKYENRS